MTKKCYNESTRNKKMYNAEITKMNEETNQENPSKEIKSKKTQSKKHK